MSERVKIHEVALWKRFQPRLNGLNQETVEEYVEAMSSGAKFPPIDVFRLPDDQLVLVDGWHRIRAAKQLLLPEIEANVIEGTEQEAQDYALFQANRKNGQRLSSADKREVVSKAVQDPRFQDLSNRELAKIINVSHGTIGAERRRRTQLDNRRVAYNTGQPPQISESDMQTEKKKYANLLSERINRDASAMMDRIEYVTQKDSEVLTEQLKKLLEALQ